METISNLLPLWTSLFFVDVLAALILMSYIRSRIPRVTIGKLPNRGDFTVAQESPEFRHEYRFHYTTFTVLCFTSVPLGLITLFSATLYTLDLLRT